MAIESKWNRHQVYEPYYQASTITYVMISGTIRVPITYVMISGTTTDCH